MFTARAYGIGLSSEVRSSKGMTLDGTEGWPVLPFPCDRAGVRMHQTGGGGSRGSLVVSPEQTNHSTKGAPCLQKGSVASASLASLSSC